MQGAGGFAKVIQYYNSWPNMIATLDAVVLSSQDILISRLKRRSL
jgi:hypothetical protein